MRIGQTSFVVFVSKFVSSALGFLATLYFARVLGAEVLGIYAAITAVSSWFALGGNIGVGSGIKKRLSEGQEQGEYLVAGTAIILLLAVSILLLLGLTRPFFESYIGNFEDHAQMSVVFFIGAFVVVKLFHSVVNATLQGQHLVHISGFLSPIKVGTNSLIQVALVLTGFGLLGMLLGYVLGMIITSVIGLLYVSVSLRAPSKKHFRSIYDYARYSWLGGLEKRTFNDVDILILTAFVPASLVGIYSVAWSISKFLVLFGRAVRDSLFPEISRIAAQDDPQSTSHLIEDGLAFGGFLMFPGLIGGVILGERLLRIYGPEFEQGAAVLGLLILAVLLHSFQKMLMTSLNALDRPDLSFRINGIFIVANLCLNIILIWIYGWVGAAIASVLSAGLGLILGYRSLRGIVEFVLPYREILRQIMASLLMGGVVWGVLRLIESSELLDHNVVIVLLLVSLGAGVYFCVLAVISKRFRSTVRQNSPITT